MDTVFGTYSETLGRLWSGMQGGVLPVGNDMDPYHWMAHCNDHILLVVGRNSDNPSCAW
jgi:hypothetical protein